jgi:hypothetical protein
MRRKDHPVARQQTTNPKRTDDDLPVHSFGTLLGDLATICLNTTYHDLGAGYHASRIDKNRKMRNHVHQLEALGYTVTLTQAA